MKKILCLILTLMMLLTTAMIVPVSAEVAETPADYQAPEFVGVQFAAGNNGTKNIRFVSAVPNSNGTAVGYEIYAKYTDGTTKYIEYSVAKDKAAMETNTLYHSLSNGGFSTYTIADAEADLEMTDVYGLLAVAILGVPADKGAINFYVRTYVKEGNDVKAENIETGFTVDVAAETATIITNEWYNQGGMGTEEYPYVLTQNNFVSFYEANIYSTNNTAFGDGKYYSLESNVVIDSSKKYSNAMANFSGNFNGNGYTISGLNVKTTTSSNFINAALFNTVESAGVVENVSIVNSVFEIVSNGKHAAAASIAGQLNGGLIENCYSEAILYTGDNNTSVELGGIVGMTNATNSRISNCVFAGIVEGENCLNAGGIVGKANTGDTLTCTITNCLNLGVVKAKICGAIIGASATNGSTEITNSFNLSKQVFKITANGDKEWNYLCGHGAYKANVASNMKITTYAIVEFSTKDYVSGTEDKVNAPVDPNYYGVVHSVIAGEESKINISHITLQEFLTKLKAGEVAGWTIEDGYVPTPIAGLQIDISEITS